MQPMDGPVPDARSRFLELCLGHEPNRLVLEGMRRLELPDAYLVSGCLVQPVWNQLCGFPTGRGVLDYDVFYFDDADLSWEAEDAVIRRCAAHFEGFPGPVQVRNQARVHLWYEEKFQRPYPPLRSSREGIDRFLTTTTAIGLRLGASDSVEVYAPFGVEDALSLVVRPNPDAANLPERYQEKAARWRSLWPDLEVLPWPG